MSAGPTAVIVPANRHGGRVAPNNKWTWNEPSSTLEYLSNNQAVDRQDKKKKEKRELNSGKVGQRAGKKSRSPGARLFLKQTSEHMTVTVEDIKSVVRSMLLENDDIHEAFAGIYKSQQFDEFLRYLLNYFHWFFEKREKESITNPVHIEPSLAERRLYEELCEEHKFAQKQLGCAYGILILGIGLCKYHHMACGNKLHSNTAQDRIKYETLYTFCTFFVWIAFKRRDYDVIQMEINRMLRTDHFNPVSASREDVLHLGAPDDDQEVKEKKPTASQSKRAPLKIIMRDGPQAEHRQLTLEEQIDQDFKHLNVNSAQLKLGIVGEPLDLFDPVMLTSLHSGKEDGDVDKGLSKPMESAWSEGSLITCGHQQQNIEIEEQPLQS